MKTRAFTIVELLVVVVIMAIMASIILPVISKQRARRSPTTPEVVDSLPSTPAKLPVGGTEVTFTVPDRTAAALIGREITNAGFRVIWVTPTAGAVTR